MDQALKDALNQILGSIVVSVLMQIAVGVGLMYVIDKFFKFVEEKLTDDTKLEIAVWLLDVKVGHKLGRWPETFAKVFDRVFGANHFSLKCLLRALLSSYCVLGLTYAVTALHPRNYHHVPLKEALSHLLLWGVIGSVVPDYLSLLETRYVLKAMTKIRSSLAHLGLLAVDLAITMAFGLIASQLTASLYIISHARELQWPGTHSVLGLTFAMCKLLFIRPHQFFEEVGSGFDFLFFCGAFFTSIWLWLYAGSGFLLKAARRFDIGFEWFNKHFDIEKKPLQSIGLVAGALVAVVYWSAVIVSRVIG